MPLRNLPLDHETLKTCGYEEIVAEVEPVRPWLYSEKLFAAANIADERGEELKAEALCLLGTLISFTLNLDVPREPFTNPHSPQEQRTIVPVQIITEQLTALTEFAKDVRDPEIGARVADFLWTTSGDYKLAELAIRYYLEAATRLEHEDGGTVCAERFKRAAQLARQLGSRTSHLSTVLSQLEEAIERVRHRDPTFFQHKLMIILLQFDGGQAEQYAQVCKDIATVSQESADWRKARFYWELKAAWDERANDEAAARAAKILAAETHISEAQRAVNTESPNYLKAKFHLVRGIEALRNIGGQRDRVQKLLVTLQEYEVGTRSQLKTQTIELDPKPFLEWTRQSQEAVRGKSLEQALLQLALLTAPPAVAELRRNASQQAKQFITAGVVTTDLLDDQGRTVARREGLLATGEKTASATRRAHECYQASLAHNIKVASIIEPARQQILAEHCPRIEDIRPFVVNNPVVPSDRAHLFARGIHAGLTGDCVIAASLLIPQIEHAVRHMLNNCGVITSAIDQDGIRRERSLNETLYEPRLRELLGSDFVVDLQCVLVEHAGHNIRNKFAHGLLAHDSFFAPQYVYFWWQTLRLCVLPIVNQVQTETSDDESGTEVTE